MRKEREMENQKKAVKVKVEKSTFSSSVPAPTGPSTSALRNARKKKAATSKKEEDEVEEKSEKNLPDENGGASSAEPLKRIRNLQKKLKEIASLKASGLALNAAQQAKVDSEASVQREIAELENQV
jgi:hypothetical protein